MPMQDARPLWPHLVSMERRIERAPRLFVATDFDGTLTPIVSHPTRALLSDRARHALAALARCPGVQVAVLSGRRLADLSARLGSRELFLAGLAGLETRTPGHPVHTHVPPSRRLPATLATRLGAWCRRFEGSWLENKKLSLSLHLRALAPPQRAPFRRGARRIIAACAPRAHVVAGNLVLDVMPDVTWSKASALSTWGALRGKLAIYLGDDANDAPAIEAVNRGGGITVGVGHHHRGARYRVGSPAGALRFLEWLTRRRCP